MFSQRMAKLSQYFHGPDRPEIGPAKIYLTVYNGLTKKVEGEGSEARRLL